MSTNNDPAEARALAEEPDISLAATKVLLAMLSWAVLPWKTCWQCLPDSRPLRSGP